MRYADMSPSERGQWIRLHVDPGIMRRPMTHEQARRQWNLTGEGLARILAGEDWRAEFEEKAQ